LEAKHHRRRGRQLEELRQAGERLGRESGPRQPAPVGDDDVRELRQHDDPPAEAEDQRGAEQAEAKLVDGEPAQGDVRGERGRGDVGARRHDALRLQELLDREVGGIGEDLRDEADDVEAGGTGDLRGLAEEDEYLLGEDVDDGERDGGGGEQHGGTLHVHAEHVVLVRSVRLPTQRLHRASHAKLQRIV
ncbi:Os03g0571800, partial [Oryza sativa Japonica Group]